MWFGAQGVFPDQGHGNGRPGRDQANEEIPFYIGHNDHSRPSVGHSGDRAGDHPFL